MNLTPLRMLGAMAAGPLVLLAFGAAGKHLADDFVPMALALLGAWIVTSAWVLNGIARSLGGWGELSIGDLIVMPLLLLASNVAMLVLLVSIGFGRMH